MEMPSEQAAVLPAASLRSCRPEQKGQDPAWQLRKYLLLLAILVASVTYAAGLDPPGGVWLQTTDDHLTGNPILADTRPIRYSLFYCSNAAAFAASLVVILLLLLMKKATKLQALRTVMALDVLCLLVAYVAGSCRGLAITIYASVFCAVVLLTVFVSVRSVLRHDKDEEAPPPSTEEDSSPPKAGATLRLKEQRKVLMLLTILVTAITYTAALNPPGGFWEEAPAEEGRRHPSHPAGDPILMERHPRRFTAFLLCNTAAFAASLVTITLLLSSRLWNSATRLTTVMLPARIAVALLGLIGSYVAGSCRETGATVYVLCLVGAVVAYVSVVVVIDSVVKYRKSKHQRSSPATETPEGWLEPATVAAQDGEARSKHQSSPATETPEGSAEPAMVAAAQDGEARSKRQFLLATETPEGSPEPATVVAAQDGEDRIKHQRSSATESPENSPARPTVVAQNGEATSNHPPSSATESPETSPERNTLVAQDDDEASSRDPVDKARALILLLATLAATVTYQAGLSPPGGVWRDDGDGHRAGELILLATQATRYKVFFYCNSAAFVASIVVVMMVQSSGLVSRHALEAAVTLDLLGLVGAYAAGSCRDARTSIYVVALAAVIFVGVAVHVVIQESSSSAAAGMVGIKGNEREKKRKLLLLLAILAVTITYQAGLMPPGKFWLEINGGGEAHRRVGDPVLADNYPRRYKAFFYCNAASFMVSVAVIVILVGRRLPNAGRSYWWPLYGGMAAGLIGLTGAYAAGTTRRVRTSIFVFVLVGAVLLFAFLHIGVVHKRLQLWLPMLFPPDAPAGSSSRGSYEDSKHHAGDKYRDRYRMSKYLLLLGILAASVTYQAGLNPPGGVWPGDGGGHAAGDPVLIDGSRTRYHAFLYSNSACFVASVVVVVLLLQGTLVSGGGALLMRAMHTVVVLDLLGLLVAYATGSSRDWGTSGYVLAMAAAVLAYVAIYAGLSYCDRESGGHGNGGGTSYSQVAPSDHHHGVSADAMVTV